MYTEEEWRKIAGDKSEFITPEQARELLAAPTGSRPRVYGLSESGTCAGQIVRYTSIASLDDPRKNAPDRLWVSGTTVADLIGRA